MSLLHPALLSGLVLAVVPILLHLLLRAKPKRLIFPALRLIRKNQRQNVRRMNLRHLWLLFLRVMVIVLVVLALTRPSLPAANYSLIAREWATLIVILTIGFGGYFAVYEWYRRKGKPRHQLLTIRSFLRLGIGVATALALLLGLGWPYARRVAAEIKAPTPKAAENIPVAAVFLFDTSASMSYREHNLTRLQQAQQIAREHLSRFPSGSKVAVAGSHETSAPAFSLDLQAARTRIDAHEFKAYTQPLNDCARTALLAQEDDRRRLLADQSGPEEKRQDKYLREVYLFTDLARSAWRDEATNLLREELDRLKMVSVYLIDVGETSPMNVGISEVKLSRETVPVGGSLKVDVLLTSVGAIKPEQTIELFVAGADGKLVKKGQQTTSIDTGQERRLTFDVSGVTGRYQQGECRIVGSDPLMIDNVGYFTVQTLPTLKVLIVAETAAVARYWQSALEYIAKEKITDFEPVFITTSRLNDTNLTSYDIVCLINVSSPDVSAWTKLHSFVDAGGGLAVFLGAVNSAGTGKRNDRINAVAYNDSSAQLVLPAKLVASLAFSPAQTIDLRHSQHALLKRIDDFNAVAELGGINIRRYWKVEPTESGIVLAKFSGERGGPALVERRLGQGRVMLMATAVDNVEWNDLTPNEWSYFVFADQLMQYLSKQSSVRCNDLIGSEVSLPLDRDRKLKKVVVRMPDFKQRPLEIPPSAKSLLLRDLTGLGSYQVDSAEGEAEYHNGFSLNLSPRESNLRRLETRDLDALLGEGRYSLNRDPASLERNVHTGRLGQEVYSLVVALLVTVFALEQFTATWFYRTDEA